MPGVRRRLQRGQALVEYALIMATVVTGFAVASAMGVDKFWSNNLDDARNKDYLVLACADFSNCVDTIGSLNQRIEYR